jgi:hypothetical protein
MERFPLNISEDERNAYEMLLAFGQLSAGEYSQYGNKDLNESISIMQSLIEKGFVTEIKHFSGRYLPKFPFLETHTHFKDLTVKINEVDSQSKTFFEERKKDLTIYQNEKNEMIKKNVLERITDFNNHSKNLKTKIDSTISEFDNELKKIEDTFISSITAKTTEFDTTEKQKITNKQNNYHQLIQSNQNKILTTVGTHQTELLDKSNNFTSSVQNFSIGYLDEVYKRLKNLLENLQGDLNNLSKSFDDEGKNWAKISLDTQMHVFNDFSNVLDENFSELSTHLKYQEETLGKLNIETKLESIEGDSKVIKYIQVVNNGFIDFKEQLKNHLDETLQKYDSELQFVTNKIDNFKTTSIENSKSITNRYLKNLEINTNNYKETVETTVNDNKSAINDFTSKLNQNFQALEKVRKETMSKIAEDMKKQQEFAIKTQHESTAHLQDGILTPFNTQYEEIKRNKNKFFSDTTKAVDLHYKTIDAKMKEIVDTFKNSYAGFTEKTQLKAEEAMKTANKELDTFIKNEQKLLTSHFNDLKKPIPGMQATIDKQKIEIDTKLTEDLEFLNQAVTNHVDTTRKTLENFQKLFIADLTADLTTLINTTDEENPKITKLDLLKKLKENIGKKQQSAESSMKTAISDLDSKILEPFKKQHADLMSRKTNLLAYLEKSSSNHFHNINTHLDGMDKDINIKAEDLNKKLFKSIESSFTKVKSDYKSFVSEQYKITDDYFKEEKKNLPVHKKAGIKLIKDINKIFSPELKRLDTTVKVFTTTAFDLFNSLDKVIISGIPDDLRTNIARTSEELELNSSNAQKNLDEFQTNWLDSISTMEKSLHSFNSTNKDQHTTEINNLQNESLDVLNKEIISCLAFTRETHTHATEHVKNDHDKFQNVLTTNLNLTKTGLLDVNQEQQTILTKSIDKKKVDFENQKQTIDSRYSTISNTLLEFISNFDNTTQERVNSRTTETTDLHSETKTKINSETSDIKAKYQVEIETTIQKHEQDYKDHHTMLSSNADEFLLLIENDSKSFSAMVRDDSNTRMKNNNRLLSEKTTYIRKVHDYFASSVESANNTASKLENELVTSIGEHYTKLISGNEGFSKEFQTTVTTGLTILIPKITIMQDFEQVVKNYSFPKVTSLPVIGRGSALQTMNSYLGNFKASVTLLIPNPSDIPVELISQTKRPKRVTLASMFNLDDPKEKEIVNKLISQDNVTVRQLSPGHGSDSGYPQYLSADRDSEEIFFGAYDSENKAEFAGMVSQNRQYIEFIGRVITSDFLSKAKKLEKS